MSIFTSLFGWLQVLQRKIDVEINKALLSLEKIFCKIGCMIGLALSAKCRFVLWVPNETVLLNSVLIFPKQVTKKDKGLWRPPEAGLFWQVKVRNDLLSGGLKGNLEFATDYTSPSLVTPWPEYCIPLAPAVRRGWQGQGQGTWAGLLAFTRHFLGSHLALWFYSGINPGKCGLVFVSSFATVEYRDGLKFGHEMRSWDTDENENGTCLLFLNLSLLPCSVGSATSVFRGPVEGQ